MRGIAFSSLLGSGQVVGEHWRRLQGFDGAVKAADRCQVTQDDHDPWPACLARVYIMIFES